MSASRWFVCTVVSAMALLGARSATAGVLYSQLDSPTTDAAVSQNFEADFDAFDSELADDFVVPAGGGWAVDTVSVVGHGPRDLLRQRGDVARIGHRRLRLSAAGQSSCGK